MKGKGRIHDLAQGLGFLAPNLLGFLAFTAVPLFFSLAMAFTNWDLKRHNMFRDHPLEFVGVDNFIRLFQSPDFWRFLGNTLFLMIGLPFGIVASLLAALLLSTDLTGGCRKASRYIVLGFALVAGSVFLAALGLGATGMSLLLIGVVGLIAVGGSASGVSLYRTMIYLPHFTAGVATFLLWKKLFNPTSGPINAALGGILAPINDLVKVWPAWIFLVLGWVLVAGAGVSVFLFLRRLGERWRDAEAGVGSVILAVVVAVVPGVLMAVHEGVVKAVVGAVAGGVCLILAFSKGRFQPVAFGKAGGQELLFAVGVGLWQCVLVAIGRLVIDLPATSGELAPPNWLTDYHWAKPAIIIMAFWAAIGSNTMLLYLAALTNIPGELYEAADIDGATPLQRFWHVTWPQLAPTTFFVVVMGIIGGLQGGFEMARVMTNGGPAGATTTLSFFIYSEGFETGRLGYSSAVAWTLFAMVFLVTLFNWRFGSRYVND